MTSTLIMKGWGGPAPSQKESARMLRPAAGTVRLHLTAGNVRLVIHRPKYRRFAGTQRTTEQGRRVVWVGPITFWFGG